MSRHMIRGRQLSRDTEHRIAMRRNLVQSLFEHGQVRTTLPKAKEVQGFAEKMITLARTPEEPAVLRLNARRKVISMLRDRQLVDEEQEFTGQSVVQKLFKEIAPSIGDRVGGYTRIIKTSDHRIGDGGNIVVLQLVTFENAAPARPPRRPAGLRRKRNERKHQFAAKILRKDKDKGAKEAAPEETKPATENTDQTSTTPESKA